MRNVNAHTTMAHVKECGLLNDLIIDLKKRELGRDHAPITQNSAAAGLLINENKQSRLPAVC